LIARIANVRFSGNMTAATTKRAETVNMPAEEPNKQEKGPRFRKPNQTRGARRRRELITGLTTDLGHTPNTMEAALITQAADLILAREGISALLLRGEPVNEASMIKTAGILARTLAALRPRPTKRRATGIIDRIANGRDAD
jgi:hypothetical protein